MDYYRHTPSPFVFESTWLWLPWYWLVYVLGFFWVWLMAAIWIRKKLSPLARRHLGDYLIAGWCGVIIGSRLFYVIVYNWQYYRQDLFAILRIWEGGMSFHGALLGLICACYLVARQKKQSAFLFLDLVATAAPPILGLGRVANFMNGELVGRPTDLPWAVIFVGYDNLPRHPSQIYQAIGEGLLLAAILYYSRTNLQRPGLQSATFLAAYAVIRIVLEWFREPDPSLGFIFGLLTMGQILCLIMVGVSASILMFRHSAARLSKKP